MGDFNYSLFKERRWKKQTKKIEQRRNREDERETTFASKIIEEDVYARSPRIKLITNNSLGAALGP